MEKSVLFKLIFQENIKRRSRTTKGANKRDETSVKKKKLLLSSEALTSKVAENNERLIDDVMSTIDIFGLFCSPFELMPDEQKLRSMCERWFDIVNHEIIDPAHYEKDFRELEQLIAVLKSIGKYPLKINRRYRIWTPLYTTMQVPPILLEDQMSMFYQQLIDIMWDALLMYPQQNQPSPAHIHAAASIMAFADLMMDGELHPWLGGCSHISTALVMWIASIFNVGYPLFASTRDEHYANIRDHKRHSEYFLRALERGRRE